MLRPASSLVAGWLLLSSTARAAWPQDADLESFIATQRPISLRGALANIGPNGTEVAGAGAGFVVASPSKTDPDCN